MSHYIPVELRNQVARVDRQRCCYCLTTAANSGVSMTYDHIHPRSKSGKTTFENICLACSACNTFKSDLTEAQDPVTQQIVPLFNPRRQQWHEHFTWSADRAKIEGITAIGRATVIALHLNRSIIVLARQRWVQVGWHPPID